MKMTVGQLARLLESCRDETPLDVRIEHPDGSPDDPGSIVGITLDLSMAPDASESPGDDEIAECVAIVVRKVKR